MFELVIWFFVIYVVFKALKLFMRFFIPEVTRKETKTTNTPPKSNYKDVEEIDFIEIKSDKKDGKDQE